MTRVCSLRSSSIRRAVAPAPADGKANNCKGNTQKSQAQKQEPHRSGRSDHLISVTEAMAMITWGEGILREKVKAERSDPSPLHILEVGWHSQRGRRRNGVAITKVGTDEIAYALPPHERTKEQQELLEDHGLRAGQRWWKERQAKAERLGSCRRSLRGPQHRVISSLVSRRRRSVRLSLSSSPSLRGPGR